MVRYCGSDIPGIETENGWKYVEKTWGTEKKPESGSKIKRHKQPHNKSNMKPMKNSNR